MKEGTLRGKRLSRDCALDTYCLPVKRLDISFLPSLFKSRFYFIERNHNFLKTSSLEKFCLFPLFFSLFYSGKVG